MTLVACATCQQPISSHAAACPKCGSLAAASSLSAVKSAEVTAAPPIDSAAFAGRWLGWAIGSMSIIVLAVVLVAGLSRDVSMGFANAGAAVIVLGCVAVGVDFYLRRKVTGDMLPVRRSEIWGTVGLWMGILLLVIPRSTWATLVASNPSDPAHQPDAAGLVLTSWLIRIGIFVGITYCLRRLQWAAATRAMVEVGRRESYAEFVARTSPAAKRSP